MGKTFKVGDEVIVTRSRDHFLKDGSIAKITKVYGNSSYEVSGITNFFGPEMRVNQVINTSDIKSAAPLKELMKDAPAGLKRRLTAPVKLVPEFDDKKIKELCDEMENSYACAKRDTRFAIRKVYSNSKEKIVAVVFEDGSREVVKCTKEDNFDVRVGVALALAQRVFGSKTQFHKFVNKMTTEVGTKEEPKKVTKRTRKAKSKN